MLRKLLPLARRLPSLLIAATLSAFAAPAGAFPGLLNTWQERYGAISPSGDNAGCQLCHANVNGGSPWNAYGWDILLSIDDPGCDLDGSGSVSGAEAMFCVELLNSDGDTGSYDNVTEIGLGTQPGWTVGASNTLYSAGGELTGQLAPTDIGPVDPDGTEPPPPPPPPPPSEEEELPFGQFVRPTIVVRPGQSIQAAIDRASPGTTIYVLAGTYRELADPVNGLEINKSGLRLIGQTTKKKRVVLQNAGNQRNGIVVVPSERNDCMGCHESMEPPFKLRPGVEKGPMNADPSIYGFEIRGFTIDGFVNNGLFTERVDGFKIIDVESTGNRNYGIFPTLSKNGLISHSRASGSDDSGIWVETSENVQVVYNEVTGNVNGFEVSNSDDVVLAHNRVHGNSVGFAILLLPDIFDDRAGAKRIQVRDNWIVGNNKPNTARPGSILASVPAGSGVLHVGADQSEIARNYVEGNESAGIAVVDYCLAVLGTEFSCGLDPFVTPEFILDSTARRNRVVDNVLVNNGTNPDPSHPFAFAAADLISLSGDLNRNCQSGNVYSTAFWIGAPWPECEPLP
jgi:parallel beta-helix repeat protein